MGMYQVYACAVGTAILKKRRYEMTPFHHVCLLLTTVFPITGLGHIYYLFIYFSNKMERFFFLHTPSPPQGRVILVENEIAVQNDKFGRTNE